MTLPTLAILAGGLATRLRPVTLTIPKSLVSVAGEPFLAHQLRLAKRQGFSRIVLLVGHLGEQIEAFAGAGEAFGLSVEYVHDGPEARGTGGAVRAAVPKLGNEFFVLYGDSYLDVEAMPIWSAYVSSGKPALMTVLRNRNRWDRSNVVFKNGQVLRHDKASSKCPGVEWIDYGFSVFSAQVFSDWAGMDRFDLSDVTRHMAAEGRLAGYEVTQRFYEIGKPEGLAETEAYLRSRQAAPKAG